MPTLLEKTQSLRISAKHAESLANFWEKQISQHGEVKALEFYKHIGLNHIESKSIEWEGMMLSREPNAIEKLCVKSIATAQDSGKESVKTILLKARLELIDDGIKAIADLKAADYHTLVLNVSNNLRSDLRDELAKIFQRGRKLIIQELDAQKSKASSRIEKKGTSSTEDDLLDELTDLTDARIANDIQARITAAAVRYTLLGLEGQELEDAIRKEVEEGTLGWLERAAQAATNKALNEGRSEEITERADEIQMVEYSAILDSNVCDPCFSDDGDSSTNEDDLTPVPNPDCAGGDWCRCFHVAIAA